MTLSQPQFNNVYDLAASRKVKQRTGVTTGVKVGTDSPELTRHEDQAVAMGNPQKTKMQKIGYAIKDALGLTERHFNG